MRRAVSALLSCALCPSPASAVRLSLAGPAGAVAVPYAPAPQAGWDDALGPFLASSEFPAAALAGVAPSPGASIEIPDAFLTEVQARLAASLTPAQFAGAGAEGRNLALREAWLSQLARAQSVDEASARSIASLFPGMLPGPRELLSRPEWASLAELAPAARAKRDPALLEKADLTARALKSGLPILSSDDAAAPVEPSFGEADLLRAWLGRQKPGLEADRSFAQLRQKYPGIPADELRRSLGEASVKPRGGYAQGRVTHREMQEEDLDAVLKIEEAVFSEAERWTSWGFLNDERGDDTQKGQGGLLDEEREENYVKRMVALVNGKIAGYLVFKVFDERIDIQKLAVDATFRFSSVGSVLVGLVKDAMKERGLSFISADVPAEHAGSKRFFQKLGFQPFEETGGRLAYWDPEIDASLLRTKEDAARHARWLRRTKAELERVERQRLENSPQEVVRELRRKEPPTLTDSPRRVGVSRWQLAEQSQVPELALFAKEHSRLAWTESDFLAFMRRGGTVLIARSGRRMFGSGGRMLGYLALARRGLDLEVQDGAFADRASVAATWRAFLDQAPHEGVRRILWELEENEFARLDGGRSLVGENRFKVLASFEGARPSYLLERRLLEPSRGESLLGRWAASLERTEAPFETVAAQAAEFGLELEPAIDIVKRHGVKILPPKQAMPGSPRPERRERRRVHVRWMIRRDMPEVLQIEQDSFENPWQEEDFLRALRNRNTIGMVAEEGDRILGYMVYELHKGHLQVLNLAVAPGARWQEVGLQLIEKLKSKLSSHRRTRLLLEVRETNLSAQQFLRSEKSGFRAVRVLRNRFEDTGEDAYLFEHALPGTAGQDPDQEAFPEERAPSEADLLRAWARRQPLERLEDAIVAERFPEVLAGTRRNILAPLRMDKLVERLLSGRTRGSGETVPYTLAELARLSRRDPGELLTLLGRLGLKVQGESYDPLAVEVRPAEDVDYHAFEAIDAANDQPRTRWTYSRFAEAVERGAVAVSARQGARVVGYLLYRETPGGLEVLRFSARPELRFRGVERSLIGALKDSLSGRRAGITARVPEGDLYRQLLLSREGFALSSTRGPAGTIAFSFHREPLTREKKRELLKAVVETHLRYQEGALALRLVRADGRPPLLLRSSLERFPGLLKSWFGIEAVAGRETETLSWLDPATGAWMTRSARSPVEIKEIQAFLSKRIAQVRLETRAGEIRSTH